MATQYILRNEAINRLQDISNGYEDAGYMDEFYVADYCLKHIMELRPAKDVEEVVHCINCYAYKKDSESAIDAGLNPDMYCPNLRVEMPPDGFCFYGAIAPANHPR